MADIEKAVRARLVANATVLGLVSTRIYPDELPQAPTLPALVVHKIGGEDETHLGGLIGTAHARIQIDCYAATRSAANALSTAVRDALAAGSGRGTWGTVYVQGCTPQGGERDSTQHLRDGSADPARITSRDFLISFNG